MGGRAPGGGISVAVPHAHLPEARGAGPERLAHVGNVGAVGVGNLAAVPEIALVAGERVGSGGDENLIGGLDFGAAGGFADPGKARDGFPDAERIGQGFATQFGGVQPANGGRRKVFRRAGDGQSRTKGRQENRSQGGKGGSHGGKVQGGAKKAKGSEITPASKERWGGASRSSLTCPLCAE